MFTLAFEFKTVLPEFNTHLYIKPSTSQVLLGVSVDIMSRS